ncbi:MAG: hypothetical protein ACKOC6_08360, partial [bacterium]
RAHQPLEAHVAGADVPVRRIGALVSPIRHLGEGWDGLPRERRDALLALEAGIPGGSTALDVAWFACDGVRDTGSIARLLAREGHAVPLADLEAWYGHLAALGWVELVAVPSEVR